MDLYTILTGSARIAQDWNSHSIPFVHFCHVFPGRYDNANAFVTGYKGKLRFHRPITARRMQAVNRSGIPVEELRIQQLAGSTILVQPLALAASARANSRV